MKQDTWRTIVKERLSKLAWERVMADVRPFVEREADLTLLTLDNVLRVLERV